MFKDIKLSMIKVVTFDLWNTLFANKYFTNERIEILIQYLNKKKITTSPHVIKKAFQSAFQLHSHKTKAINFHHITMEERFSKLKKLLNFKLPNDEKELLKNDFEEIMLKDPPLLKTGARLTLDELSSKYNFALISNTGITPGRIIRKVFQEYDILKYFKMMVFSDEI